MPNSRTAVLLVMLAFFPASCGSADAQKGDISAAIVKQQLLSLNVTNNRQHLSATVSQQIQITLGTVGPKYYGTPQMSSPAIRVESVELAGPQNPGGPTFVYFFEATAEGEAQVKIPVIDSENPDRGKGLTFIVTIECRIGCQEPVKRRMAKGNLPPLGLIGISFSRQKPAAIICRCRPPLLSASDLHICGSVTERCSMPLNVCIASKHPDQVDLPLSEMSVTFCV